MTVHVRLFAIVRDRAGTPAVDLSLDDGATVAAAAAALAEQLPAVGPFLPRVAYAVNEEYASLSAVLRNGDELAVIPPVSGGRTP